MPDGFGTGLGAFGGGLGRGFAGGLRLGAEMSFRRRQEERLAETQRRLLKAQQRRQQIQVFQTLADIMKQPPATREFLLKRGMPLLGMDPKSQEGKDLLSWAKKAGDEELQQMGSLAAFLGLEGVPAEALPAILRNPTLMLQVLKLKEARKFAGGGPAEFRRVGPLGVPSRAPAVAEPGISAIARAEAAGLGQTAQTLRERGAPFTLGPGQRRFVGGREIVGAPERKVPGRDVPFPPAVFAQKIERARAGKTVVDIRQQEEGQEAKTVGKFFGTLFADLQKASRDAQARGVRLNRAKQLLDQIRTGFLAPTNIAAQKVAKALGFNVPPELSFAEAFRSLAGQFTLDSVQRTKGAVSDREMNLFSQIAPSLATTNEGNLLIIELAERMNELQVKAAQLARQYRRRKGRIDEGFLDELDRFHAQNPLFTKPLKSRLQGFRAQRLGGPTRVDPEEIRRRARGR